MNHGPVTTYVKIDGCNVVKMRSYDILYVRWQDFPSQIEDILDDQEAGEELLFKITILPPMTEKQWEDYCEKHDIDWPF